MDINELRNVLTTAQHWDFTGLLSVLRDPSATLRQDERNFIADLIETGMKRPNHRPPDSELMGRALTSYVAFLRNKIALGGKVKIAYELAADDLGINISTVRDHVKMVKAEASPLQRAVAEEQARRGVAF